jgi:hypothetical protein
MRTVAPGLDQKIATPRPEPPKLKPGEKACPCGTYPAWYCDQWPRCVAL